MKHWILIGLLTFGTKIYEHVSATRLASYYSYLLDHPINPENTLIVFDWHNVLQEQHFGRIILDLLLRNSSNWSYVLNCSLWDRVRKLVDKKTVTEYILRELGHEYSTFKELQSQFIDIVTKEPLIDETIDILRKLKEQGYTIYMFSNIAPETLEVLKKRVPDILGLFDGIYTPNKENNYVQKPSPIIYQEFHNFVKLRGDVKEFTLFIDDREKNVQAGFNEGMYGVVYKSSDQLKEILESLKILEIEA